MQSKHQATHSVLLILLGVVGLGILAPILSVSKTYADVSSIHATSVVPLVTIKTDLFPEDIYKIGVVENTSHELQSLYYENENNVIKKYSLTTLTKGVVLLKKSDMNVVVLYLSWNPEIRSGTVTFNYLYNGLTKRRHTVSGHLTFNVQAQRYELRAEDDDGRAQVVDSAFIEAKKYFGQTVGIEEIVLQ